MFDAAPNDLDTQISVDAYYHLVRTLGLTLPPPLTEEPEDLARRDHAVIARIAALAPANAAEAELAGQFVAASEQWKDCLRLAQQPETTPEWAMKCRAQANAMMRQANGALRLLLRMQAFRHKIEADYPARDRIARIEHVATALMAEALAQPPVRSAAVSAAWRAGGPRSDRPPSEPAPPEQPTPTPEPATPDAEEADLVAAAERYAALYPERAAAIRRAGRLPADIRYFSPPEAALAPALIAADTPALAALDGFPIAPNLTPAN